MTSLLTISDFFGRAWRGWWLYFVAPLLAFFLIALENHSHNVAFHELAN